MPIQRPLDFFTSMGPGDVLLAGHLQVLSDPGRLQVTPPQCQVDFDSPAPGQFRYLVTLPGKGPTEVELSIDERLYFWVHLYDSTPDPINLVIEAP